MLGYLKVFLFSLDELHLDIITLIFFSNLSRITCATQSSYIRSSNIDDWQLITVSFELKFG